MKRDQKKSNNKGFSLVELIVVIAIMAVLMGVLAPTLLGNVEKSRESTDLQNLDTIQGAVTTAMNQENVAKTHGGTATVIKMSTDGNNTLTDVSGSALASALSTELQETLTQKITLKSGQANKSGNELQIVIAAGGAVEVRVVDSTGAIVRCAKTKAEDGSLRELKAGNSGTAAATTAGA